MNDKEKHAERRRRTEVKYKKRSKYFTPGDTAKETPKPCSCDMCGNPRKYFKAKTIQEKKADEYFHDLQRDKGNYSCHEETDSEGNENKEAS